MTERKSVDWEAIEREYRAGQLTVVEIGRQHGLSHTAINKRAKRDGWTRNLADRVRKKVSARLEVSPETKRAVIEPAIAREPQGQREPNRQNEMRRFTIELRDTEIEALVRLRLLAPESRMDDAAVLRALYGLLERKLTWVLCGR
jgi:hypothetical protein